MNQRAFGITLLLFFGLYVPYGIFSLPWITVLPIALALAVCSLPGFKFFAKFEEPIFLSLILFFFGATAISLLPSSDILRSMIVDVAKMDYIVTMRVLFVIAAIFTLLLFYVCRRAGSNQLRFLFFGLTVAAVMSAFILIIPTSPKAQIDVWTVQEEGAHAFVDFKNPYKIEYTNIFPENLRPILTPGGVSYSYLPGTFMWMAPWAAADLDTRYSQILTRFLTSLLLLLIAWEARHVWAFSTFVPSLVFLSFPLNTYFIERAWNDDISVMCYSLAAWGLLTRRRWAVFIACNFLLVLKQHAIFLVPLLIWFAWRASGEKLWKTMVKSTVVAAAILGAYLIAGWRDFLGSLYGLTFLKFPNVHTVFPDRRDPFSLMNYLNLYVGYKNGWFFILVIATIAVFIMKALWSKPQVFPLLRGIAAMALAMFVFSPIAFINYYGFAWALTVLAFAAQPSRNDVETQAAEDVSWEFKTDWWLIAYVATRATILFCFSYISIETYGFEKIAARFSGGLLPFLDYDASISPASLIPALVPRLLQQAGASGDFVAYHMLFQLVVLVFDLAIARSVFSRFRLGKISRTLFAIFIFAPLLVAPLYLASANLATVGFVILIVCLAMKTRPFEKIRLLAQARPRAIYLWCLSASILVFAFTAVVVNLAGSELNLDRFLTPTDLLIWTIALAPFLAKRTFNTATLFTFAGALVLTFFLLFHLEEIYALNSNLSPLVLGRNILIGAFLISFALSLYPRKRLSPNV